MICRSLPTLREWDHDKHLDKTFTDGARAGRADGTGDVGQEPYVRGGHHCSIQLFAGSACRCLPLLSVRG